MGNAEGGVSGTPKYFLPILTDFLALIFFYYLLLPPKKYFLPISTSSYT
jgi:hypothetical protein